LSASSAISFAWASWFSNMATLSSSILVRFSRAFLILYWLTKHRKHTHKRKWSTRTLIMMNSKSITEKEEGVYWNSSSVIIVCLVTNSYNPQKMQRCIITLLFIGMCSKF
jgi:hypothetical protein